MKFTAEEGVAWKVKLPGLGMSTPAVWDDHIVVTCGIDGKDGVLAYNFNGDELWRNTFNDERQGKRETSSGSNPSPVTDGRHVVVYYKSGTLACIDLAGDVLWQKNLQNTYGEDTLWWDVGSSPIIAGSRVVVAVMQGPDRNGAKQKEIGKSYLAAFDLDSGEEAWKVPRQYQRPAESDNAYTTPMLLELGGREVIVLFGADHLTAHDPANGELVWDLDGFNPDDEANWRVIASPAIYDGMLVVPFGRAKFLAGVRLDAAKPEKVWERGGNNLGSDVPSPVARDGKAFVLTDKGRVQCIDVATGKERWAGDLPRNRNNYFASPVLAGDTLYCARQDGVVFAVDVADGFKQLAENDMGENIVATPVPVRGGLLIRGAEHLFWIAGARPQDSQSAVSP